MDRVEHDSVIRSDTTVTIDPDRPGFLREQKGNPESNSLSNSRIEGGAPETVIVIDSEESGGVNGETGGSESRHNEELEKEKGSAEQVIPSSLLAKSLSSIKGKGEGGNSEVERICRICHLSSGQSSEAATMAKSGEADLIHLGCCCKDELGIAHSRCAEAWFKFKGNRKCEICGEAARNVGGGGESGFMEEWSEGRRLAPGRRRRGWRGQSLCNFLMACLVIAFVLPWFFRIKIF